MGYFARIALLPAGSYEYHGTELPPDTDTIIASRVANSLVESLSQGFDGVVEVLPSLTYGLSAEHEGLPTTGYVRHATYYEFVLQLVSSLTRSRDLLIIVNGHGGNTHALGAIEADFNYAYPDRKLFIPHLYPNAVKDLSTQLVGEFDAHAGSVEASLIAHYLERPSRSYMVALPKRVRGALRFFRTAEITPHGVIKQRPEVIANPEHGLTLHDAIVHEMTEAILRLAEELGNVLGNGE